MSEINHLRDIYKKRGQEFIDKLFNSFVTVNEKMNGSSFNFERDIETGEFIYFKRNQKNPITLIDRTISKYYEVPINYIESLSPSILEEIPRGWRFGTEYFYNQNPLEISYDRIPKNHMILSYVQIKDKYGNIKRTIQEKKELDYYADLLGIERPAIFFQGNLNDDQKAKIFEYIKNPGNINFSSFIIQTLNPNLNKTTLNNNLENVIEGVVFRFGELERGGEVILAKMIDPIFNQMLSLKRESLSKKPTDFLGIAIMDIMNFILEKNITSFAFDGDTDDLRYISFMSDVFIEFMSENKEKYRGMDFQEPDYIKREEFRVNIDLLDDERVEVLIKEDFSFESLFKLILNSFRKIRKKSSGIITKNLTEMLNSLVIDINTHITIKKNNAEVDEFITENEIPLFKEFYKNRKNKSLSYLTDDNDQKDELDNEELEYSLSELKDTIETIQFNNTYEKQKGRGSKEVNLIIGRFQPFHLGHLKTIKEMKSKNNLDTIVAIICPNNINPESPFDKDVVKKYMNLIKKANKEIDNFFIFKQGILTNIISKLNNEGYKINLLASGEDRKPDYQKQLEYIKYSNKYDGINDIEIFDVEIITSGSKVRENLLSGNYSQFKKMVPSEISSLFTILSGLIKINIDEEKEEDSQKDQFIIE